MGYEMTILEVVCAAVSDACCISADGGTRIKDVGDSLDLAAIAIAISDTYPDVNLLECDSFFSAATVTDLAVIVEQELNKPHLSDGPIGQKD
jgi:hypothetical protein